jgi:excisionase family DNA binding protein
MNDDVMTVNEVAKYLKVNERTIYRLAASSGLPAFKVGNSWRFKHSELEAWIKSQQGEKRDTGSEGGQAG